MMVRAQPSRSYDSSGRRARAAENRNRIVRAAHALFVRQGFTGTTIAAVARAAEVSAPTVYAAFDSKAALLKRCIDVALAGDEAEVPVADRPLARWVYEAENAVELLGRFAVLMGVVAGRAGPIYNVAVSAADAEPDLAELLAELEQQRLLAATRLVDAVRDRGALPPGRSRGEARDAVWVCIAPELYVTLTRKRRWSTRRYVTWARNTLIKLVLEPADEGAVPKSPL